MIGVFDYTVILTYLSLISAGTGIIITLSDSTGHPYLGVFFLLLCGLFDAFDGRVARTKKDRTDFEKKFGIQIDSLCDIVAFGVLPACIGASVIRTSPFLLETVKINSTEWYSVVIKILLFALMVLFVLAGMIRLAFFNVAEEEGQNVDDEGEKCYSGLPITSSALVFPSFLLIRYIFNGFFGIDITIGYFVLLALTGLAFILNIKIKKPGLRGIIIMIAIGFIEFILLIFAIAKFQPEIIPFHFA